MYDFTVISKQRTGAPIPASKIRVRASSIGYGSDVIKDLGLSESSGVTFQYDPQSQAIRIDVADRNESNFAVFQDDKSGQVFSSLPSRLAELGIQKGEYAPAPGHPGVFIKE